MKTKTLLPALLLLLHFSASSQAIKKTLNKSTVTARDIAALPSNMLYVVNDSITGKSKNVFKKIKPADIISLRKVTDPTETAVYGTRGANGVVLVTTDTRKTKTSPM